jgi:hypothetical protein
VKRRRMVIRECRMRLSLLAEVHKVHLPLKQVVINGVRGSMIPDVWDEALFSEGIDALDAHEERRLYY